MLHGSPGRTIEVWEANPIATLSETINPVQGHLPEALVYQDAIRLTNGKVLVAGGTPDAKETVALSACYEIDPITEAISATGSLGSPRWEAGGLVMLNHGEVLIAGGVGPEDNALTSCELYDSVKKSWAWTGAMAVARRSGSRLLLGDGRVLAVGGWDGEGNLLNQCELYDPDSRSWSRTGNLNVARKGASYLMMAGDAAVAIGGEDRTGQFAPPEVFDPARERWEIVSSPKVAPLAMGLPGNALLVVGGFDPEDMVLASCERYDLATDTWTPAASLPRPRFGALSPHSEIVRLPDGKILIAGGAAGSKSRDGHPTSAAILYDPDADAWTTAPALPIPRRRQSAIVLADGRVLLVAGEDDRGPTSRIQIYDPR
ncbi:hypothetical protein N9V84_03070 [Verrucomicrobiales bacterium]|nr:hypothetical protein [Verrucomicrobiales bacterium]